MTKVAHNFEGLTIHPTMALKASKCQPDSALIDKRIAMLQATLSPTRSDSSGSLSSLASSVSIESSEILHEARAKSAGLFIAPKSPAVDAGSKFNPFSSDYEPPFIAMAMAGDFSKALDYALGIKEDKKASVATSKVKASKFLENCKTLASKIVIFANQLFTKIVDACFYKTKSVFTGDFLSDDFSVIHIKEPRFNFMKSKAQNTSSSDLLEINKSLLETSPKGLSLTSVLDKEFKALENEADESFLMIQQQMDAFDSRVTMVEAEATPTDVAGLIRILPDLYKQAAALNVMESTRQANSAAIAALFED